MKKKIFVVCLALCLVSMADAATRNWTGNGEDDYWSTAANWDTGTPGTDEPCIINYTAGGQPVINSATETIENFKLGTTTLGTATCTVDSGGVLSQNTSITNDRWINIAASSGTTAILNLKDEGTITTKAINVGVSGTGTLNMLGGTLNIQTSVNCATQIKLGALSSHSISTFNMDAGTLNLNYNSAQASYDAMLYIGAYGSTTADEALCQFNMSGGTLNMNNGAVNKGSILAIAAGNGTSNAEFNLSGGTINMTTSTTGGKELFAVGYGTSSSGTMNMTGGTINIDGTNTAAAFSVGYGTSSTGVANISGGTVNARYITLGRLGSGTINLSGDGAISIGSGMRIGESTSRTGNGILNMTGGSITGGYVGVGYVTANASTTPDQFNISGGTVDITRLLVGRAGNGNLTITGSDAKIMADYLFVGCDGDGSYSIGTVKFNVGANGVTAIQADSVMLGDDNASSLAYLLVNLTAAPPIGDILLVDNKSENAVAGLFDSLNGGSAAEGALVTLTFNNVGYNYSLTYIGGVGGNDVMLLIPEPATIGLLALGSLLFARRRNC